MLGFGKKKKTAPLPSSGCMSQIRSWDVPQPTRAVELAGDAVAKVYVYDAAPLADADPDGFFLDVAYVDGVLQSRYTSTAVDTAQDGFVAVMLNGLPVGTVDISKDKVIKAAKDGVALKVFAYADGWLQFGHQQIRGIKAKVPKEWTA